MLITRTSPLTGRTTTQDLAITEAEWSLYMSPNRPLIQDCFPNLDAAAREFIMTGYTQEDWAAIFPPGWDD